MTGRSITWRIYRGSLLLLKSKGLNFLFHNWFSVFKIVGALVVVAKFPKSFLLLLIYFPYRLEFRLLGAGCLIPSGVKVGVLHFSLMRVILCRIEADVEVKRRMSVEIVDSDVVSAYWCFFCCLFQLAYTFGCDRRDLRIK